MEEIKFKRDLQDELLSIDGITFEQCGEILEWINSLPIEIKEGVKNTKVSIRNGVVVVEPNN